MAEGIVVSLIYVILCFLICAYLQKHLSGFIIRKILHILMTNWWFIRLYYLENKYLWIGPVIFALVLYYYTITLKIKGGMCQFCISLTIMTFITTFYFCTIIPATCAMLVLGYADSIAAIVGRSYQLCRKRKFEKSILGTFTFIIVAFVILLIFCKEIEVNYGYLILCAMFLGVVEHRFFPKYDNITVPLITFVLMQLIL